MRKVFLAGLLLCVLAVGQGSGQSTQSTARKVDEIEMFNCEDLAAHLDAYAIQVQNEPGMLAYVIVFGGQRERRGEPQMWEARIKHYLTKNRGLDAGRVVTTIAGYRERRAVELWILRPGVRKPFAGETIEPEEVKYKKGRIKKSWYRQCGEVW